MEIRKAELKDINRILALLSEVLELHATLRPDLFISGTTKYNKEDLEKMIGDNNTPIYVATINDYVVGHAMCQIRKQNSRVMYPKTIMYLDDLCVDNNYRHQGIGKALYNKVVELAKENNCESITLNAWLGNESAMKFYEKMGLKIRNVTLEGKVK